MCESPPPLNATVAVTAEIVQAAAHEVSELAEYYTYDPTMDTSDLHVGDDTFSIAAELRHQVNIVASALASMLTTDGPPATLCVPAYCQTAEKRSAANVGGPNASPFEVSESRVTLTLTLTPTLALALTLTLSLALTRCRSRVSAAKAVRYNARRPRPDIGEM